MIGNMRAEVRIGGMALSKLMATDETARFEQMRGNEAVQSSGDAPLPIQNEHGFFEIRLESIGGLGANVAGQIFAEAGVLHAGLNGSNFASYGSEKKGSPVKGFVRFAQGDQQIRDATPVERPHVLAVFHEALLHSGANVLGGLYEDSTVIVNTRKQAEDMAAMMDLAFGRLGVLPALDIAVAEGSRVNMAMLGALTRACAFIDPEAVVDAVKASLGVRYPRLLEGNLKAFWRGYHEVQLIDIEKSESEPADKPPQNVTGNGCVEWDDEPFIRSAPILGYETAPVGGVITTPGNSIHRDLSASREGFLPEFIREKCTDCAQCDLVCPDICFVWEEGVDARGRPAMVLKGIDYQYCKGCLKCVEACPFDALVTIAEVDGWAEKQRVPHVWGTEEPVAAAAGETAPTDLGATVEGKVE